MHCRLSGSVNFELELVIGGGSVASQCRSSAETDCDASEAIVFGCHRVNGTGGGGTYNVQQQGVASGKLPLSSFFASPFVRPLPSRPFLGPPLLIVPSASHRTLSEKSSLVDGVSGVTERYPCFVSQ